MYEEALPGEETHASCERQHGTFTSVCLAISIMKHSVALGLWGCAVDTVKTLFQNFVVEASSGCKFLEFKSHYGSNNRTYIVCIGCRIDIINSIGWNF